MQYQTPMYTWQNVHIVDELWHHGIYVEIFNPLHFSSIDEANDKLVKYVEQREFDLFMTCNNETVCYVDTLLRIKKKMPTVLICFDNLVAPYLHKNICSYFDLVWLTAHENKEMFQNWGCKYVVMPYAANPYMFKPLNKKEIKRCTFIGTPYGSRVNTINALTNENVPVSLYANISNQQGIVVAEKNSTGRKIDTLKKYLTYETGRKLLNAALKQKCSKQGALDVDTSWLEIREPVPLEQMSELYSAYSLALSSTTARNTGILKRPVEIINLRSFEIPMCGGIQLCRYNHELAEYFEDGKEIIFYQSNKEMVDKAKFYLKPENEKLRKEIKQRTYFRVGND